MGDASYLFDQIMRAAEGYFLVDLGGTIEIVDVRKDADESYQATAKVGAEIVEPGHEIVLRSKQSSSGRWRVLQVSEFIRGMANPALERGALVAGA